MVNLHDISLSVQSGKAAQTTALIKEAIRENYAPDIVLRDALIGAIMEVEKKFLRNEILDAEVLVAESAMKAGIEALMPYLNTAGDEPAGTVIVGTLEGDIRDIEKNIIAGLMLSLGLKVVDLGTNVPNELFIESAVEEKVNIIACTTTLVSFLPRMKLLIQAADQAKIRGKTKILLSGGPVTEWFCKCIEADMYAPSLIQAAEMAVEYCRKQRSLIPQYSF
ncbi:MAG: cobalamin-dependent protein [Treponema sp.]|nr:cobalamin-dependent protein [Treponema sp.]